VGKSNVTPRRVIHDTWDVRPLDGSRAPKTTPIRRREKMSELDLGLPDFESANCKGLDPDLFYDDYVVTESMQYESDNLYYEMSESHLSTAPKQHAYLRRMCLTCPEVQACREWAIVNEEYGFWGGMTATERRSERVMRNIPVTNFSELLDIEVHLIRIEEEVRNADFG
jgi:hypothetical protein